MIKGLEPGDVFEGYRITRTLAEGGMAIVFEAIEEYSDDVVAIKVLLPHLLEREHFAQRFRQECKFYPMVKHPNIVRMRRAGVSNDGIGYIVMDFLEGMTLRDMLNKVVQLKPLIAVHFLIQTADAMWFAHSKGITHRDLKPENIMICTEADNKGKVYVLDFGIARLAEGGLNTENLPNVGTVRYMAPEQAEMILGGSKKDPNKRPDGRADIYSFGGIAYEAMTGQHWFIDDDDPQSARDTMAGHLVAQVVPIHHLVPDCPQALSRVVARCLAIDPNQRYQSFEEVAADLRALVPAMIPKEHWLAKQMEEEKLRAERQAIVAAGLEEPPASGLQSPASGLQSPASDLQSPASDLQSPASGLQPDLQHRTVDLTDFVPPERVLPFVSAEPAKPSSAHKSLSFRTERISPERAAQPFPSPASPVALEAAASAQQNQVAFGPPSAQQNQVAFGPPPPVEPTPEPQVYRVTTALPPRQAQLSPAAVSGPQVSVVAAAPLPSQDPAAGPRRSRAAASEAALSPVRVAAPAREGMVHGPFYRAPASGPPAHLLQPPTPTAMAMPARPSVPVILLAPLLGLIITAVGVVVVISLQRAQLPEQAEAAAPSASEPAVTSVPPSLSASAQPVVSAAADPPVSAEPSVSTAATTLPTASTKATAAAPTVRPKPQQTKRPQQQDMPFDDLTEAETKPSPQPTTSSSGYEPPPRPF